MKKNHYTKFQSPCGVGVVQTLENSAHVIYTVSITLRCRGGSDGLFLVPIWEHRSSQFQSPRGEGVVQTANPQACMVMRQTRI